MANFSLGFITSHDIIKKILAFTLITVATTATTQQVIAKPNVDSIQQLNKIDFQNRLANIDISIGEVEVVLQDQAGFIWLGGRNALLRYDANTFKPYDIQTGTDTASRTPVTQVVDLFEDSHGTLWVATRNGVLWFDRELQIFRKFERKAGQNHLLDSETINKIIEAPDGNIIVATYTGLCIVNPKTHDVTLLQATKEDTKLINGKHTSRLHHNVVHDIILTNDGNIWLATEQGLSLLHWTNKTFTPFLPNNEKPNSLPDNDIWAITQDASGNLWAGTHNGLYYFNVKHSTFKRYQHNKGDKFSIGANLIRDVMIDKNNVLWIGTDGGGLNLYDKNNDRFIRFTHQKGQKGSLASNSTRAMYEDNNSDLWIGTYPEGINFFDRSSAAISLYNSDPNNTNSLPHNSVLTLQEDNNGNLWLGTDGGGVSRFNRHSNTFEHYQTQKNNISSNAILSSLLDSKGNIWVGTWGGAVNRYNTSTNTFDQIPFDMTLKGQGSGTYQSLNDEAVWSIYEDKRGHLWIGTHSGGLSRYDLSTKTFLNYSHKGDDPSTIANQLIWTTFEDSKNRFWVGTANGLDILDRDTGKVTHFTSDDTDPNSLSTNSVLSIFEDSKQRLWFGTDWGINRLNDDNTFTVFGVEEDFVDKGIRSITEDTNGNLWLGTNNGIIMFNPDNKTVNNYKRAGGSQLGGFNTGAVVKTQRGEIAFGGTKGLRIFNLNTLSTNKVKPPAVLTDFKVFTKPVPINGPDNLLSKDINLTNSITLDYKKNMFSLNFSALNYRDPDKNQYAYKLEGFDKNWREVGNQRSALYTNLDGGTYTFKVKGSNNDGVWNDSAKTLTIIQLPPPWKTWWAYVLYSLMAVGLIARFVYAQRKKRKIIELQKQKLEVMVAERTSELRVKNDDIQAMLSNMRQGLCTVEPDGNIHPEYSSFLEDIFHTKEIAGHHIANLLFKDADIGSDNLNQAKEAIKSIIGEDEMNFTFNAHVLPTDLNIKRENYTQYLSLDWDPIIYDGTVSKLMVSVRDTTALKEAEGEALAQKRELDIIAQLIKVPSNKYLAFENASSKFLKENKQKIQDTSSKNLDTLALLFRNMHTIKGNCRTYGFKLYSDVVHDVESTYSNLKNNDECFWDQQALLNDIKRVEAIAKEYSHIYYSVLGHSNDSNASGQTEKPALDSKTITHIQKCISEVAKNYPEAGRSMQLQSVNILLNIAQSNTITSVLSDIVNSLPSIAEQIKKPAPLVTIDDSNIRITTEAHELLNNVFAHLLRNSLDHGIEPPEERVAANKNPQGTISIYHSINQEQLYIHIKDDGRGINIDRLLSKGIEMGKWKAGETPKTQEIANLIFDSGTSTKEEVSAISGRGVGMDAVKQFLQQAGGDIKLMLLEDKKENCSYVLFETIICLPPNCFSEIKYNG